MIKLNIFSTFLKTNLYNTFNKYIICNIIKKFLFKFININLCYVTLLDVYIFNKYYKYNNFPTNLLIFNNLNFFSLINNELILCPLIIEKECFKKKLRLFLYYFLIIIHGLLHIQNIHHYINFQKKLIQFISKKKLYLLKKYIII